MSATVLTLGTFDLLHPGHVHLFRECRDLASGGAGHGGSVHAAVNPDEFVEEFKGRRPVQTFAERLEMVAACRYVDVVHRTPGPDAKPLITELHPRFIVIGSDWRDRDYYGQLQVTQAYLDQLGCTVVYLERVGDLSSTELKDRVRAS